MTTIAKLVVALEANAQNFTATMDAAEKKTNTWSKRVSEFAKQAGEGMRTIGTGLLVSSVATAGAALTGLTLVLKGAVQEAMEAEAVESQLNAVLKSTGGVAGVTADQAKKLADSLAGLTPFEDDVIIGGENMLLTFTNIGKNVFPQATETMLDMSQALGQDLKSSAIQLGKSLQDPIEGVTALRRVGVNFTDAQQNMIKSLVESGKMEEAQIYILKELQTEFGGSAKAAGKTFAGQLAILTHKVNDFKEALGAELMPALQRMLETIISIANRPEVQKFLDNLLGKVETIADFIGFAFETISQNGLLHFFSTLEDGSTYFDAFLMSLGLSAKDAAAWGQMISTVGTWVITVFNAIATALVNDKGIIIAAITAMGAAVAAAVWSIMSPLLPAIAVILLIAAVVYVLYEAWKNNWFGIRDITMVVIEFVTGLISARVQTIRDAFAAVMQFIQDLTSGKLGWLSQMWKNTMDAIGAIIENALAIWRHIKQAWRNLENGNWYMFGVEMRKIWDALMRSVGEVIKAGWENLKLIWNNAIKKLWEAIKNINWIELGKNIIQGIINGLFWKAVELDQAIRRIGQNIKNAFAGFFGIHSESKVMKYEFGWEMAAGTVSGFEEGVRKMLLPSLGATMEFPSGGTMPGMGSVSGSMMQPVMVVVDYHPLISTADENEAKFVLAPMIEDEIRRREKKG